MVEVVDGHAEFGMSGGAAFSSTDRYQGLLSHQIEKDGSNIILLIPSSVIYAWLDSIFKRRWVIDEAFSDRLRSRCFSTGQ